MKKLLLLVLPVFVAFSAMAQNQPYTFKEYKRHKATPVKNQEQTGTCWAFSTVSFLESEALRLKGKSLDLSEMYIVRNIYRQKCENYVRRQGTAQFGEGGLAHDAINAAATFGLVPESVYPGRKDPKFPLNHGKLEKTLKSLCTEYVKNGKDGKLSADWLKKIDEVLDEEFGPLPTTFVFEDVQYTPQSFRDFLNINPEDYVTVTSFTHHPFWGKITLEIPDNWAYGSMYNVPLSDMMRCAKSAIDLGYTVEWDADVSNDGFSAQNGLAIVPATAWKDKDAIAQSNTFKLWEPETKITQELRQSLFDSQVTTDDHLMHVVGILDEKNSGMYYVTKNSWGEISENKGYVYCSEAYMRLNTISFMVHKNAVPNDIAVRLGLKSGTPVNIDKRGPGKSATPGTDVEQSKPVTRPAKVTPAIKIPAPKSSSGNH